MKGIWKKCLGLTAGLLAVSVQSVVADTPDDGVIARTPGPAVCIAGPSTDQGPANSAAPPLRVVPIQVRPLAVSLERPRPLGSPTQQASYSEVTVRAQAADALPLPAAPPLVDTLAPSPRVIAPSPAVVDNAPMPRADGTTPSQIHGSVMPGMPIAPDGPGGFAEDYGDAHGIDPDRFAAGDLVSNRFTNLLFLETEALFWSVNGTKVPPLLTTGVPMFGMPAGVLGSPTTEALLGGTGADNGWRTGTRFRAGVWLDHDHSLGLEGSYFFLTQDSTQSSQMSNGALPLAVPLTTAGGIPTVLPLAGGGVPGMGALEVLNRLWGAEANIAGNLLAGPNGYLDLIGGFRVVGFDENLHFGTATTIGDRALMTSDGFDTRNRFWGGQFGVNGEYRLGCLSLGFTSKLALGATNEVVKTGGMSALGGAMAPTGLLVNGLNFGRFSRNEFAVLPELGVKVGYQITDCIRATLGYNLMWLSNVARPGEQIDSTIGGGHPIMPFRGSDLWVHGVTAGLEMRY
jgi:hypothetical protein